MQNQLSMMTPRLRTDNLGAMNSSPTRTYVRFGLFRNLELMTTSLVVSIGFFPELPIDKNRYG